VTIPVAVSQHPPCSKEALIRNLTEIAGTGKKVDSEDEAAGKAGTK